MNPMRSGIGAKERGGAIRRALVLVLVLNLAAVAIKLLAWRLSGSLSVGGEVVHSGLDAGNNVMALIFARIAGLGPDDEHPYGHAKFETLGALLVVGFLAITVFELVRGAVRRLVGSPFPPLEISPTVLVLILVSLALSMAVATWEHAQARKLGSPILEADSAHTRSDVWATLAVLAGLFLTRAGYPTADPLVALVIAGFIALSGWRIVRSAVPVLVDERLVEPGIIDALARSVEGVAGCREIRSRGPAGTGFVEMVIEVEGGISVAGGHEIADEVEAVVAAKLGAAGVSVHVEPTPRSHGVRS
jgi:cation diffusion facilitator family transporter